MAFTSKDLGNQGEELAKAHLLKQGYQILAMNYKTRQGEIDLICKDKEFLVFVEVKTRSLTKQGIDPKIMMTKSKRLQVRKMGEIYLAANPATQLQPRFDFIGITFSDIDDYQIEHIPNAF